MLKMMVLFSGSVVVSVIKVILSLDVIQGSLNGPLKVDRNKDNTSPMINPLYKVMFKDFFQ